MSTKRNLTPAKFPVGVTRLIRDEGSILLFGGYDFDNRREITFACDHRVAEALLGAIEDWVTNGRLDGDEPVALVEEWQVVGP